MKTLCTDPRLVVGAGGAEMGKTLIYVGGVGSEVREQVDDDGTPRYKIEFIKNPGLFS